MPLKLRFQLHGPPPVSPFQHAAGLQASLLRWVAASDPQTATLLHDANQPKPYAVSPLWSTPGRARSLFFDVSVLVDSLADPIAEGARREEAMRLGHQHYRLDRDIEIHDAVTYADIVAQAPPRASRFPIRLLTPTAHHARNACRKAIVLPAPENYYGSWLNRWNICAPIGIDERLLATVDSHVAIADCAGRTQHVELDRGRSFIGFVGEVSFEVLRPHLLAAGEMAALAALARFAGYCGTGVETTHGMGQTEALGLTGAGAQR